MNTNLREIFVAVHGIGDQTKFETVQAVAKQVSRYLGKAGDIPVGAFHSDSGDVVFPHGPEIGFAEVHWADVVRQVARDGYTLEETKSWVNTVVERLRAVDKKYLKSQTMSIDYVLIKQVLDEMVDGVRVLERLLFAAQKAGVLEFDLRRLLEDFLGDVQFVTEFETYRNRVLERFEEVMAAIEQVDGDKRVYIIAHSEGTIVTLIGLLRAAKQQPPPHWLSQIGGLMTLGSPIDKHIVLWPDLWNDFKGLPGRNPPIKWYNYYDTGDPVGFELDTAREWLRWAAGRKNGPLFEFDDQNEWGYTKYYFPGKAHVDYWGDDEIFEHFLTQTRKTTASKPDHPPPKIRNWWAMITSYVAPYLIAAAVIILGVYLLRKSVAVAGIATTVPKTATTDVMSTASMVLDVLGLSAILAGTTILARIPRLMKKKRRWLYGVVLYCLGYVAGASLLAEPTVALLNSLITEIPGHLTLLPVTLVIAIAGLAFTKLFPHLGVRPLIWGGSSVFTLIGVFLVCWKATNSLWPVILAGVVFMYLWWLAVIIFDLTFLWHRYIRHSRTTLLTFRKARYWWKDGNRDQQESSQKGKGFDGEERATSAEAL